MKNEPYNLLFSLLMSSLTISSCCNPIGSASGIDCSKFAQNNGIRLIIDMDSVNKGFTYNELSSIYVIRYDNLGFKSQADTTYLDFQNAMNEAGNLVFNLFTPESDKDADYLVNASYLIASQSADSTLKIDSINMQIEDNNSECCSDYKGQKPYSFILNSEIKLSTDFVLFNKRN